MQKVWVFDIDNTLANVYHRWHHLQNGKKEWKEFFEKQIQDEPFDAVVEVLHALLNSDHRVIIVTGRDEKFREVTMEWLREHLMWNLLEEDVYMRPAGNREDDDTLKVKIIKNWLQRHPNYKVGGIFEDRHRIIDAFREEGWYTFECNQERLEY